MKTILIHNQVKLSHSSLIHCARRMSDLCNNMVDMALDLQSMDMELLEVEESLRALHLKEVERDLELEAMVRCATCFKVPSASPIMNCPTGHLVCSSCYRGRSSCCPVCKRRMGKTVSLLAQSIIGSIHLSCKNKGVRCKSGSEGDGGARGFLHVQDNCLSGVSLCYLHPGGIDGNQRDIFVLLTVSTGK